jgi:hypothetical protein
MHLSISIAVGKHKVALERETKNKKYKIWYAKLTQKRPRIIEKNLSNPSGQNSTRLVRTK